ncbi:protein of unknown function [Methylocella tundrae]|uniref:Uncharacterized protein n=1 Tax=Methylocella tundrae TaxID=227605 RepID=A0A4U8Z261_METTU|nr:protein of unknown function [Methylocella tundrae]
MPRARRHCGGIGFAGETPAPRIDAACHEPPNLGQLQTLRYVALFSFPQLMVGATGIEPVTPTMST